MFDIIIKRFYFFYYERENIIMLKKEIAIDSKIKAIEVKKEKFTDSILPSNLKSKYLTCACCGSKIRKDLFHGFKCPACKTDFISPTSQKRLDSYNLKIKKLYDEKKQIQKAGNKRTKSSSKVSTSTIHMIDLNKENLTTFKYMNYFDTDAGFFSDVAYGIPLQSPCTDAHVSDGCFENGDYPYIIVEHEQEVYGNDTHDWNAYYDNGNGSCDYIATKEIDLYKTMNIVEKWIMNHKDKIQNDFNKI